MGPGKPGKSWNFYGIFQDWKVLGKGHCFLESAGNLLSLAKKHEVYGRQ